jgi:hypothetical protein
VLTAGQPLGQRSGILSRGVDVGVGQPAGGRVHLPGGFQAGQLAAQPVRGHHRRHRFDMHSDVDAAGKGGQGL